MPNGTSFISKEAVKRQFSIGNILTVVGMAITLWIAINKFDNRQVVMGHEVENIKLDIIELKGELETYNMGLIDNRLTNIEKSLDKIATKLNIY